MMYSERTYTQKPCVVVFIYFIHYFDSRTKADDFINITTSEHENIKHINTKSNIKMQN